ncbi:PA26 p53-induced protein-domain-containing protein [Jimgerdemannia flammicorona]|uniref:PA26 p53-induced protein-domain-containing protein n=1 Tax=Jimgerdemannia flammicorona TaxID=994334 RepID=A0A433PNA4_9FUNG|nr:PA26 p53-induced protein-domain-containing protein [Jimgerdemannia flammicorona]
MGVPVPVPIYPSPSFFVNPNDIISLESATSSNLPIPYPRPAGLSISPWADDSHSVNGEDYMFTNEPEETNEDGDEYVPTPGRPANEHVRILLIKTYVETGRLSNLLRVKAFFPTYVEKHHVSMNALMRGQSGPLHRSWRNYIAIMAASQHNCQYLVSLRKSYFLQHSGDPSWLKGLAYAPTKLQNLATLASMLAWQPWRIKPDHIAHLVKIGNGSAPEDRWTISELVQAIVIMATYHSLSSFVLGCGIVPEMDTRGGYYVPGAPGTNDEAGIEHELYHNMTSDHPVNRTKAEREALHAASAATGWDDDYLDTPPGEIPTGVSAPQSQYSSAARSPKLFPGDYGIGLGVTVEKNQDFLSEDEEESETIWPQGDNFEDQSEYTDGEDDDERFDPHAFSHSDPRSVSRLSGRSGLTGSSASSTVSFAIPQNPYARINPVHEDLTRFLDPEAQVPHEEFDSKHSEYSGEYCWEDHGCELVSKYLPGLGEALDEQFSEALNITDWSIPNANDIAVDTWPLRQAIWYYTLRLFGIKKEDYAYSDINRYLNPRMQQYIKKVCCSPEEIRYRDWKNIGLSLRPEEKCHVNLLAVEARKQVELVYALYAVDNYHRA